jgi:23S rRNA pseudouridine1911/1915/1917 synthase
MDKLDKIELCFLNDYEDHLSALRNLAINHLSELSASQFKKFFQIKSSKLPPPQSKVVTTYPIDLINRHLVNPEYLGPPISILFEDERFIVLDKPHHIHTHPLLYSEKDNCLSYLRHIGKGKILEEVNPHQHERGLLFRLDYSTSGVLVYVKSFDHYLHLRENYLSPKIIKKKEYMALVMGDFSQNGFHEHELVGSLVRGHKIKVTAGLGAKLYCEKMEYFPRKNISLVKISLQTGKRHQIRAQLAHLNHPIVGDTLYLGPKSERIYLHSHCYQIENDTFVSPCPFDIEGVNFVTN